MILSSQKLTHFNFSACSCSEYLKFVIILHGGCQISWFVKFIQTIFLQLQAQKQDLARQAEFEADKVAALQANAERLQASLASTKERLRDMESVVENARSLERQRLRDWDQEREQERRKQVSENKEKNG